MDFLVSLYFIIEIFVLLICGLICGFMIIDEIEYDFGIKTILENSFLPQIMIVYGTEGIINKYGKAVLIILTAPFLIPLNLIILVVQALFVLVKLICKAFVFVFKEKN